MFAVTKIHASYITNIKLRLGPHLHQVINVLLSVNAKLQSFSSKLLPCTLRCFLTPRRTWKFILPLIFSLSILDVRFECQIFNRLFLLTYVLSIIPAGYYFYKPGHIILTFIICKANMTRALRILAYWLPDES
ncbi:hypothetical protein PHYBLDRAFT_60633 [Phycomyces blakesleeanus NRRL 1555(-)]|uniref:Uncharacterized protein n=1 Tax=Phycomyces blakesleeanus (strain ATCC 8743b / DSM 1359 / FGSC 10004 / NBRC 33097 / NRRL 1555) TaxID=763407 RepID=A0A163E9H7_PHYB8|nr:hypothetical protein PHYBLDRAFT_60633 [Phycomyces blakesleeanus NRRL 1555(-)]OAD77500.1 hypothetical protein PHYBLDRAFT_60633 [Phycomyces blakesleeanus NRRL 1555(-)]|eukprot:XP_018295540.1 hypothetical protein PHYBLDRAFT_60633 [Phycomyces blakesleeanus NRRL 1555(-)]